jgi:hypothetical protein
MRREKFTEDFIFFVKDNFNVSQHVFILVGGVKDLPVSSDKDVNVLDIQTPTKLLSSIPKLFILGLNCKKIIVHGLSQTYQLLFFFCQPWLIKKMFWVIWGADLYSLLNRKERFVNRIFDSMKKLLIRKCQGIISLVPGDYEIAKRITKTKAVYYNCFMYPHAIIRTEIPRQEQATVDSLTIMVGNSASHENQHSFVFEKISEVLKKSDNRDVKVMVPLSYGDAIYAEKIIKKGRALFGKGFMPITSMLDKDEYFKLLDQVDIAIFGFKRQQAMGNILSLLALGKKIYIRTDITPWSFLKDKGFDLFDIGTFDLNLNVNIRKNQMIINDEFSVENSVVQWQQVFEG